MKRFVTIVCLVFAIAGLAFAQNTNSTAPSSRTRTVAPRPSPTPRTTKSAETQTGSATQRPKTQAASPTSSSAVLAAFNNLLDAIRHADPKAAANAYQNTSRLVLFNYNGTVTRGWDQLKQNREASYPQMKDVKLDVRDVRVTMLGRDAALITCLWTQSLTFRGAPETDTGRMTIVFRKVGGDWKAIHLHTSNDSPDPSRVPGSEQTPAAKPTP